MADYSVKFQEYIERSIKHILAKLDQAGTTLLSPDDQEHALQILDYALKDPEIWPDARRLLLTLAPEMERAGCRSEWMSYLEQGIRQSQMVSDDEATAELQFHLGVLYELVGKYREAHIQLKTSEACFERLNLPNNQARTLNRLAQVARRQHQYAETKRLVDKALALLEENAPERGYSCFVLGATALDRQDWSEAARFFNQAYHLWETGHNTRMMAWSLNNLGLALQGAEKYQEAIKTYQQAIDLMGEVQDPVNQAVAQMNLGEVYLDLEKPELALELFEPIEKIFQQAQEQLRLGKVYGNIGTAYYQMHQWTKAQGFFELSIEYLKRTGNILSLTEAMDGLGLVYREQGNIRGSQHIFEEAINALNLVEGNLYDHSVAQNLVKHLKNLNNRTS